jgi:hypothetical protein
MPLYYADKRLVLPQNLPPTGEFLLPVCTTAERLNRTLAALYFGGFHLPSIPAIDPQSDANIHDLTHVIDIFQAMAHVNDPASVACYVPSLPGDDSPCRNFEPLAPWIRYAPNDPFQTPEFTPPGYLLPPWYQGAGIPLPGVQPGDAMVNLASFPIFANIGNILEAGLPRFSFLVDGTGEIEIEFVNIPQGGYAVVNIDNDPFQTQLLDLNLISVTDVVSLEGLLTLFGLVGEDLGIENTQTHEINIDVAGTHTVNVTFIPNIGSDTIFGFGGGVRRISLCGFSADIEVPMPQLRIVDCDLEWRPQPGTPWVNLGNVCGADGQDGAPGIPGQDGREIELRTFEGYVQWRYVGAPTWTSLYQIPIPADGEQGEPGIPGQDGADGREVELREYFGAVQWRYVGDALWQQLYNIPGGGVGSACFDKCDYTVGFLNAFLEHMYWFYYRVETITTGNWNLTRRAIVVGDNELKEIGAGYYWKLDNWENMAGVTYDLHKGRYYLDNPWGIQPDWSVDGINAEWALMRPQLTTLINAGLDDCGILTPGYLAVIQGYIDTERKNEAYEIPRRRAWDVLYAHFYNMTTKILQEQIITHPTHAGEDCLDPDPPNPCPEFDWGIELTLTAEDGWITTNGLYNPSVPGVFLEPLNTTVPCPISWRRVDVMSPSNGGVTFNVRSIEAHFWGSVPPISSSLAFDIVGSTGSSFVGDYFSQGEGGERVLNWTGNSNMLALGFSMQQCLTQEIQEPASGYVGLIRICGNGTPPTWI